jgi:hypothetical protein
VQKIFTLMVFVPGQPTAIVLQYKEAAKALKDRNILIRELNKEVVVADDFGRELAFRPNGNEIVLYQDVDLAAEGNTIGSVKNHISNTLSQIMAQEEAEKDPTVKAAMTRARLTQGMNNSGAFRA